jgi:arylsulfatase A-like enzyme
VGISAATRDTHPDILVVVLDCLRAKSTWPWSLSGVRVPNVENLTRQSTVFSRCLSVASWSLPAHATLLTGLYPWNHGVFGRGARSLKSEFPTIAERLTALGYRTLCLSANPFVSLKTGLTRGFESAYWGDWASHYMRFLGTPCPPEGFPGTVLSGPPPITLQRTQRRLMANLVNAANSALPGAWKWANIVEGRLAGTARTSVPPSAPWIEPSLEAWLGAIGPREPVCCFVNLMDAHEPYFVDDYPDPIDLSSIRFMLDGLDRDRLESVPDVSVVKELERRYNKSIEQLDSRLGKIVDIFSRGRSPASTLVMVTSDHGQSFGEGGHIFHTRETGDELLRVPLLVRFPGENLSGAVSDEWTSLVDVAPTILEAAGAPLDSVADGESLARLIRRKRQEPVLAMGDGATLFRASRSSNSKGLAGRSKITLLGYLEDVRVDITQPDWVPEVTSEGSGPSDKTAEPQIARQLSGEQVKSVQILLEHLSPVKRNLRFDGSVDGRLAGWGY